MAAMGGRTAGFALSRLALPCAVLRRLVMRGERTLGP